MGVSPENANYSEHNEKPLKLHVFYIRVTTDADAIPSESSK